MSSHPWNLVLLDGAAPVGVLADRQLSVAALTVLLTANGRRQVAVRARGFEEVRAALGPAMVPVVLVESMSSGWTAFVDVIDPGRTLLLIDPHAAPSVLLQAVNSGANGFLSLTASPQELEHAIDVLSGESRFVDPVLAEPMRLAADASQGKDLRAAVKSLSPRETDVLTQIAAGRSSKEIARECGVTPKTVCNHVSNIYAKLHLRHRGQLVLYADRAGLVRVWDTEWAPVARGA